MSTTVWSSTAGTTVTQSLADQAATSATNAASSAAAAATSATEAAASAAAGLAKVSSNDTTPAVLSSKIVGDGSTLTVSETNDGSNETLTLSTTGLQASDATLTALSGLTVSADQMIYATGSDAFATTGLTSAGRALLDDSDVATMRGTLGLGSAATSASTAFLASASPTVSSGTLTLTSSGLTFSDGTTQTTASSGGGGGGSLTIADENSDLSTAATKLAFVGAGVTASGTGATKTITIPGGGSGITVQNDGSALSTLGQTLNFVGSGVTASGTGATKTITISSGDGGSGNFVPVSGGTFTGNVGIGVTSPSQKLEVLGNAMLRGVSTESRFLEIGTGRTGNGTSYIDLIGDGTYTDYGARFIRAHTGPNTTTAIRHRGTGTLTLLTEEAAAITLRTNNTERVRIDSSGNVGIGTSTPDVKFQVQTSTNANIAIVSGTTGISAIDFGDSNDRNAGLIQYLNTDNAMTFRTSGAGEDMRIDSSGNVGIGTNNPQNALHISSTSPRIRLTDTDTGVDHLINANSSAGNLIFDVDMHSEASGPATLFYIQGSEKVRIDSSGNVGIGVSNPLEKLDVNGNFRLSGAGTASRIIEIGTGRTNSGYAFLDLVGDTTYTDYGVRLIRMNTGANADSRIMHRGTGELSFRTQDAAPITLRTTNTERMRVDSSGHILIGTTSSTADLAYSKKLKISGSGPALILEETDTSQMYTISALSGSLIIRDATNTVSRMQIDSTGDITFHRGVVNLESASGNPAQMNFYCESGNAHFTRIQSAPHSSYSGNVVLTLPTTSGELATTGAVATTGKAIAMAIVFG